MLLPVITASSFSLLSAGNVEDDDVDNDDDDDDEVEGGTLDVVSVRLRDMMKLKKMIIQ